MYTTVSSASVSQWWGRYRIGLKRTAYWQVGPLHLWIQHLSHQWRLSWAYTDDWLDPTIRVMLDMEKELPPDGIYENLFAFRESSDELQFSPLLANRPVVTKLETALNILSGEEIRLYISTPLWIKVDMTNPAKPVREIATFRPSDTWFGPVATPGGELCYSSRTPAVLKLDDIPFRPHCAITAVNLRNLSTSPLKLERLNLPMPRLSLFHSQHSGWWTDMITLEWKEDNQGLTSINLERQPPGEAAPTQFVAAPRLGTAEPNMVFRAFSAIFRERGD